MKIPVIVGYTLRSRPDLEKREPIFKPPGTHTKEESIAKWLAEAKAEFLVGDSMRIPYAGEVAELYAINPDGTDQHLKSLPEILGWYHSLRYESHEVYGFHSELLLTFLALRAAEEGHPRTQPRPYSTDLADTICPNGVMSFAKWHQAALRSLLHSATYLPRLELGKNASLDAAIAAAVVLQMGLATDYHAKLFAKAVQAVSPAPKATKSADPLGKKPTLKLPTLKETK